MKRAGSPQNTPWANTVSHRRVAELFVQATRKVVHGSVVASTSHTTARHGSIRSLLRCVIAVMLCGTIHCATSHGQVQRPLASSAEPTKWRVRDVDTGAVIIQHQRKSNAGDQPDSDPAYDAIRIQAGYGTQVLAQLPIEPVRVISELTVAVPLRSDRIGLQAMVRVILPRSTNPSTGSPISVLIPGSSCESKTEWNTLVVQNIPIQLQRNVRFLQLSFEETIDVREAYVDRVLVNVYGGAGLTNVTIADPIVGGAAPIPNHGLDGAAFHSVAYHSSAHRRTATSRVEGGILYLHNRPSFVRMIDDQGEPWSHLKALGINTVRLSKAVTFQQMSKARELGMWVVSPPPRTGINESLVRHFDRVIAWDLGSNLSEQHLSPVEQAAHLLRSAGPDSAMPLVCAPTCRLGDYGNSADVLIHGRAIPFAPGGDYGKWIQRCVDQVRPNVVHWAAIETQPADETIAQSRLLGAVEEPHLVVDEIQQPAFLAVAAGARGVYYRSRSRLDSDSKENELRQIAIHRTNLELQLIEPWLAAGQRLQPASNATATDSSSRSSHGKKLTRFRTNDGTLFLIANQRPHFSGPAPTTSSETMVTLPNVNETSSLFRISAGGLVPIKHQRVPGGTQLALSNSSHHKIERVLVTRGDSVVLALANRVNRISREMADLAMRQIDYQLETSERQLERLGPTSQLRSEREAFEAAMATNDWVAAHETSERLLNRLQLQPTAFAALGERMTCALATHGNTANALQKFLRSIPRSGQSVNLLSGGGCDQSANWVGSGWQCHMNARRATATATISNDTAYNGEGHLRIAAAWNDASRSMADDRAIVWAETKPVSVADGQIVRIGGWVRIRDPLQEGALSISDSTTGPALGLRLTSTKNADWQPFTIYRAIARATDLQLRFAMTGPGSVDIDEISITPIMSATPR